MDKGGDEGQSLGLGVEPLEGTFLGSLGWKGNWGRVCMENSRLWNKVEAQ